MARNVSGITIKIDGDTTELQNSLKKVDNQLKTTQSELKNVEKRLKINPSGIELLKQKQKDLQTAIKQTEERLTMLKEAQSKVSEGSEEWETLQREINDTETELQRLEQEYKNFGSVAAQQVKQVGEQMQKVGQKMQEIGKDMTRYVTLPIVAAGAKGVKSFAEVDKTMQLTNKTMNNSAEQADMLNDAMEAAASNSIFGMSDAADATLNFARAGLTAEAAAAALAPAMNLAAGEGGNLDTVSAGLVGTINAFGDSFDRTGEYADVFAAACNNSALDIDSLSSSMSTAAPIFATAGYTIEDAALYMGVMANNGIEASEGANALKTGLAKLIAPAKEGSEWMKKLGIEVTNADGSMKDTITVQKELHDAFAGLSESEQIAAASAIFGKNQMSKWLALINTAPDEVGKLNKELRECGGTTQEMSDAMMDGFGGSIEKLKSSLDVLMTSLGKLIAEFLQPVIDKIQAWVDKFNALDDSTKRTIIKIAGIVAAIGPLLIIGGKLITGIGMLLTFAPLVATAFSGILVPMLLITAGVVALIAVGVWLFKHWDQVKAYAAALRDAVVNAFNNLKDRVITAVQNLKESTIAGWQQTKAEAVALWENIKSTVIGAADALKNGVTARLDALKNKVTSICSQIKQKFEDLKNKIKSIADSIKNAFNFNFQMPHIKMPHLTITYEEADSSVMKFLGINRIPHFSVEWYKKAYENPVLFNSPTVLATPNGYKGFGDGNGAEIVMGLDKLRELVGSIDRDVTVNVVLQGDARQMFKVVRQENLTRTRATNWNPLGAAAS